MPFSKGGFARVFAIRYYYYVMVTAIWRSSQPTICGFDSFLLGQLCWKHAPSTPLSCLMPYGGLSCHPSSDFPAPEGSDIFQSTCERCSVPLEKAKKYCIWVWGFEKKSIFRTFLTRQQSLWFPQNCTVYTVIVSNFRFWVGISENKRVAPFISLHLTPRHLQPVIKPLQRFCWPPKMLQGLRSQRIPAYLGTFQWLMEGWSFSWWDPGGWKKIKGS